MIKRKLFVSSFLEGFPRNRFATVAQKIEVPQYFEILPRQRFRPDLEILLFWRVLKSVLSSGVALLFSSRGYMKPELLACIVMGFLPKRFRPAIVLYGEMFQPDNGVMRWIERFFIKLVDRSVYFYVVYSTAELELFPELWGVNKDKMRFCPFYIGDNRIPQQREKKKSGKHIFAGGNSHRDFESVIEAAKQMPEYEFVLATKKLPQSQDFPPNVRVDWMSLDEYLDLIDTAAAVIVPLTMGLKRTTGLLTILESLSLEKVIIVPDALGIRDYVFDHKTGIVVTNLPDGYVEAIRWVLAPENQDKVSKMGVEARRSVLERFTLEKHVENLLSVMHEAIDRRASLSQE